MTKIIQSKALQVETRTTKIIQNTKAQLAE